MHASMLDDGNPSALNGWQVSAYSIFCRRSFGNPLTQWQVMACAKLVTLTVSCFCILSGSRTTPFSHPLPRGLLEKSPGRGPNEIQIVSHICAAIPYQPSGSSMRCV